MTIEDRLQAGCVTWFRLQYPKFQKLLFAVPNGGSRNKIEAAKLKATGTTPGVADLIFLYPSGPYPFLCIEMKISTGRQSPEQKDFQKQVQEAGGKYDICRSLEQFMQTINNYLKNEPVNNLCIARHTADTQHK